MSECKICDGFKVAYKMRKKDMFQVVSLKIRQHLEMFDWTLEEQQPCFLCNATVDSCKETLHTNRNSGMVLCKCGHWIGIVNGDSYHMDYLNNVDKEAEFFGVHIERCLGYGSEKKYQKICYHCECVNPCP